MDGRRLESVDGVRAEFQMEDNLARSSGRCAARREFLAWMGSSSLAVSLGLASCAGSGRTRRSDSSGGRIQNVFQLRDLAQERLGPDAYAYLAGGADDRRTLAANEAGYRELQLRARRLIDVSRVDTTVELFGWRLASPILLSPVGFQAVFHPEAELGTVRAAAARGHRMFVSSVSTYSVGEIAAAGACEVGFQLYPTTNRDVARGLLRRAERAGCRVVALTVDTPVLGNREGHDRSLEEMLGGSVRMGNYEGLPEYESFTDPTLTWDFVGWMRANTSMQIVLKGIVTREDAALAVEHGADGIIVSNHGGRQLESDRSTIACLPEVLEAVEGRFPVLIDGGIRRGTDVVKALALGARAVCIGRPFAWGLGALGQAGVELALELLQAELVRDMQLVGAPSLSRLNRDFVA